MWELSSSPVVAAAAAAAAAARISGIQRRQQSASIGKVGGFSRLWLGAQADQYLQEKNCRHSEVL